ncbi:MAG: hypothetical protein LBR52_05755 [Prevotellaceae bacterium]|nr:hypothetical protein [Prevotellaceae bacterium]
MSSVDLFAHSEGVPSSTLLIFRVHHFYSLSTPSCASLAWSYLKVNVIRIEEFAEELR